jgi:hypothetical protein
MTALRRSISIALIVLLGIFGAALAQDDAENQNQQEQQTEERSFETRMVGGEEFVPFGEAEVGEPEPFEADTQQTDVEVETGAIIIVATTPDDQRPNVDLVGPDNYFNHFEVSGDAVGGGQAQEDAGADDQAQDDAGAEDQAQDDAAQDDAAANGEDEAGHVVDGLLPGIYSIAATDDGLQMVHTVVEVAAGQAVRVQLHLEEWAEDFVPGAFATDGRTAFPAQGFRAGDPRTIDNQQFGGVSVETEDENARFVVTGPNAYSQEFTGAFEINDLQPGVYVIAGTDEGAQIATSTVEVEVSTATTMVPAFTVTAETEEVDGDVAGGGEAEEGEEQTEGEQPGDEQEQDQQEQQEDETQEETDGDADGQTDDETR